MKLTIFQLFILFTSIGMSYANNSHGQGILDQVITIKSESESVSKILKELEKQLDIKFIYSSKTLKSSLKSTLIIQNEKLSTALGTLLDPIGISYEVLGSKILLNKIQRSQQIVPSINQGQDDQILMSQSFIKPNFIITGYVKDEEGNSLVGASVQLVGKGKGTTTDLDGKYLLEIDDDEKNGSLEFSYVGYKKLVVSIKNQNVIDVILQTNTGLEEVVVVGYGTRSKRDVTSAISKIGTADLENTIAMSSEFAMQGRMAGVQIAGNSGNPMVRPTVRIRGVNTWGVSSPLYVIDGIPITEFGSGIEGQENARAADVRGPLNIMAMIDPNDIESISVLKDATAAAIYGVRAANGVILITTKKGRGDAPSIDFSSRYGIQNIRQRVDVLNTQEYTKFLQDVFKSDPTINLAPENENIFDSSSPNYLGNSPTYDWQSAINNANAPVQEYSVRLSGGTQKTDYFISGGYSATEGTLKGSNLDRLSGSFKINSQVNDWLKIGANYRISSASGRDNSFNVTYWQVAQTPPWQPIFDPNGVNGYAAVVPGFGDDGIYRSSKIYGVGTRINVLGQLTTNDESYKSLRNLGNAYLEIEPIKNLRVKGQISIDNYTTNRFSFTDFRGSIFNYTAGNPYASAGGSSVGSYGERDVYNNNLVKELSINYTNSFNDHNLDLLLNGMEQKFGSKYTSMETEFLTTTLPYLRKLGGENKFTNLQSELNRNALAGLLGRIGYNYKYKYYLDLTIRRDGSSRFAPENRWGTFPAVSAAWRVSEENFMNSISWISDLKIRTGWGKLGNQEVRDLAYLSPIDTRPSYSWGNNDNNGLGSYNNAAAVFALPNPNLRWETTATANVGIDATLFNSLNLSLEYYNKLTKGILQEVSLPNSVGVVQQPVDNIASVRNSGIELSLNYSSQIGGVNYSLGGNITTVKNVVENTYNNIPLFNIEKGYPLFYQRGYKLGGIFQNEQELKDWKEKYTDVNYQTAKVAPGDFYFQDIRSAPNNPNEFYSETPDNKIDNFDQVYLGKTIPGYFYGLNAELSYKKFDFGFQFTGVGDVVKYNEVKASLEYTPTNGGNLSRNVLNSWTPTNNTSKMPRVIAGDPAQNFRNSDYFVENASYLRLSYLQLGYSLPSLSKMSKGNIKNIRIYTGVSNLFTITKYTGFDPENDKYPMPQVLFFGLNARI